MYRVLLVTLFRIALSLVTSVEAPISLKHVPNEELFGATGPPEIALLYLLYIQCMLLYGSQASH